MNEEKGRMRRSERFKQEIDEGANNASNKQQSARVGTGKRRSAAHIVIGVQFLVIIALLVILISLNGSGWKGSDAVVPTGQPPIARDVIDAFVRAGFPVTNVVEYTEETDTNNLLGRPGRYISKVSFDDTRKQIDSLELNNTIETFSSPEDAAARKLHLENAWQMTPMIADQYMFVSENELAILRVSFDILPNDAKMYERAMNEFLESGNIESNVFLEKDAEKATSGEATEIIASAPTAIAGKAGGIDWGALAEMTSLEFTNRQLFPYVKDTFYEVNQGKKQVSVTAIVRNGTDASTVLDFADTLIRRFAANSLLFDSTLRSPGADNYGELFDTYSIMIGISDENSVDNQGSWYVFQNIPAGVHTKIPLRLQR